MPVQKESKLGLWLTVLREGWLSVRARFDEWKDAVCENPALIWATPAVRYATYTVGGLIALWVLTWGLGKLQPPSTARPPAKTADFHVRCTNPACGDHFVINRKFGFDDFPVVCPKCKQKTGAQAWRCVSSTCHSRWVVPVMQDAEYRCPHCGGSLGKAD
ncbi:MAG: hypothetical protein V2A79_05070 [Planctomycetota bacterium]